MTVLVEYEWDLALFGISMCVLTAVVIIGAGKNGSGWLRSCQGSIATAFSCWYSGQRSRTMFSPGQIVVFAVVRNTLDWLSCIGMGSFCAGSNTPCLYVDQSRNH